VGCPGERRVNKFERGDSFYSAVIFERRKHFALASSLLQLVRRPTICEFFSMANVNRFFITESNEDSIIRQLFRAAESCIMNCFSQIFSGSA